MAGSCKDLRELRIFSKLSDQDATKIVGFGFVLGLFWKEKDKLYLISLSENRLQV